MNVIPYFLGAVPAVMLLAYSPFASAQDSAAATSEMEAPQESESQRHAALSRLIRRGLAENASLNAAYESYQAAARRAPQVSSLPDPRLTYGYFLESVETRVGPQDHKLGVAQSFPWFGTLRERGDAADAEARAELARFFMQKNTLVFEIIKTYAELAYLDSAVAVTKEIMELVQSWENVLQERFRTATGSHSDLVRVQVELGKLEDLLSEYRDMREPLRASLQELVNQPDREPLPIGRAFLEQSVSEGAQRITVEDVLQGSPQLHMLDALIEARQSGVLLAEKDFFPDFTVGLDYTVVGDRDAPDGGDDALLGMVSIDMPLYLGKRRAALAEAKSRRRSVEQLKVQKQLELRSAYARAAYDLRDSRRKSKLYRHTLIPKTQESIEASYTAYESGSAGFLDVIDAEQQLLDFQLSLSRARADTFIAAAKLQELAGGYGEPSTEEDGQP